MCSQLHPIGFKICFILGTDEFKVKAEISFDFDHRRENILQNTDKWIVEITSQVNILKKQLDMSFLFFFDNFIYDV